MTRIKVISGYLVLFILIASFAFIDGPTQDETLREGATLGVAPIIDSEGNFDQAATTAVINKKRRDIAQTAPISSENEGSSIDFLARVYRHYFGDDSQ